LLPPWLRSFSEHRSARRSARGPSAFPLLLERLEDRTLFSAGWAVHMGGSGATGGLGTLVVPIDAQGNAYIAGNFSGTVDFDPGPGTFNLTSTGATDDAFVAKYTADGSLAWARRLGGTDSVFISRAALDAAGNITVVGDFYGTADFDPGPGTL